MTWEPVRRSRSDEVVEAGTEAGTEAGAGTWTGVKVFSATKARERAGLGEVVTAWLRETRSQIVRCEVRQSSDNEFHALTIVLFYREGDVLP